MTKYNCDDCQRLIKNEELYRFPVSGWVTKDVCARCYAIRVKHPSARKLVK